MRSSFVQATYVNYVTPTIQHAGKYTYISRGDITQYNFDRNATFNTNSNSGDNITDKMILNNSTICVFANLGGSYTNVHTTLGVTYFDNPYTIKINGEAISMYPVATHDSVNDITCGKVGTLKSHTIDLTITNKQNGYTTPPSAPYRMNDTYAYPVIEKIIDSKSGSITGSIESNKEFCVSFGFYDYDIQGTIKNNLIYDTFSGDTYSVQLNGKDVPISSFGNNRICANTGTLSGKKANITISNGINTSAAWPILTSAPIESTPVITQPIITPTIAPSKLSMTLTGFNPKLTGADAYTKGTALQDT